VGTGLNAGKNSATLVVAIRARQSCRSRLRSTRFASQAWATSSHIPASGGWLSSGKVASDLRLLSMGPRAGLSEITLVVQPGSPIMLGRNPSVPEMVNRACFQVSGCD
jgi:aspartate ammonia-lyase